jgi:hypothetical protein
MLVVVAFNRHAGAERRACQIHDAVAPCFADRTTPVQGPPDRNGAGLGVAVSLVATDPGVPLPGDLDGRSVEVQRLEYHLMDGALDAGHEQTDTALELLVVHGLAARGQCQGLLFGAREN